MTAVGSPSTLHPLRQFANAAQWLAALGDVPLERIIVDPLPGTATEADLLRFVEREDHLCELIDGTLVEKPVGSWEGLVAVNLIFLLKSYLAKNRLGVVFADASPMRMKIGRVRLPDVSYFSYGRLPKTLDPVFAESPDLAVEVLSEGNTDKEMNQKLIEYFQSGTRLVWFIDPRPRTVAVYHRPGKPTTVLTEQSTLDGEDLLPGLTIAVAELFSDVPRGK
jgi:Uma2 family endonuclease